MSEGREVMKTVNPFELFQLFFSSVTPEMTPIGIRSQGMQAIHHFWEQRFLNVFRGIPEEKGLDQFSDLPIFWLSAWRQQQAKVEGLQRQNQMLSDSTLEMGSKHIRDTDLINQQASTLFRLREFIYGSGDLREYSDEELLEHQRILKAIVVGEQALKGEA